MAHTPRPYQLTRRSLIGGIAAGAAAAILAACGDETPTVAPTRAIAPTTAPAAAATVAAPTTAPTVAPTTAPAAIATTAPAPTAAASVAPATTGAAATTAPAVVPAASAASTMSAATGPMFVAPPVTKTTTPSRGELRLTVGTDFPTTFNVLKEGRMQAYGPMETLMRQTPENKVEPMLAERIVGLNATTWRVTVRQAKFHDGSPVTADDVMAAMKKNWDNFPDLKGLISPDTKMTKVDDRTVEFVTPTPTPIFPYALTLSSTGIHKPSMPGGTDGTILTGPYKMTKLVVDNEAVFEPFADHWAGTPPLARISMRFVSDPNARALALQSGDVDMLYFFPPEALKTFGPDIDTSVTPSGRVGLLSFNLMKPPFTDRDVREAFSLGVDRSLLNTVAFDGKGAPASAIFPSLTGYDTIPIQTTDAARARQLLDSAGWKMGADGVRAKGADRLAVTVISGPGRPDQTPSALSMKDQLKPLGFDIKVTELTDSSALVKAGMFDGLMKANQTLPTANPLYEYNRLFGKGGGDNVGNYLSPKIEELLAQMRVEGDPAKLKTLSLQVQETVKGDVPLLFLCYYPITAAFKKGKVKGYIPHPNDSYILNREISVS